MIVRQSDKPQCGAPRSPLPTSCQTLGHDRGDADGDVGRGAVRHAPRRLEHASTVDRVAEELRRAVFDGELESGTPLREVALAESLGVSRPTVREALTVLVAEGLATREPNRGVAVATPDPESVARRLRGPAACSRAPASGAGTAPRRPTGEARAHRPRRRTARRSPRDASYQRAQRAAPGHPRLPGRADRVAAAGRDAARTWSSSSGSRWPRSTGSGATPTTRPTRTQPWSTCSRTATSTRRAAELEEHLDGRRERDPRGLGLEPDPAPADQ